MSAIYWLKGTPVHKREVYVQWITQLLVFHNFGYECIYFKTWDTSLVETQTRQIIKRSFFICIGGTMRKEVQTRNGQTTSHCEVCKTDHLSRTRVETQLQGNILA